MTRRLTTAQALVEFLAAQRVERDGVGHRLIAGCFGIFGHGNVAGVGQALHQAQDRLRLVPARNEQAMVHAAAAFARHRNRLSTWACTTSIGPGATNLVTGAAAATINRLPVLLLPGDIFASYLPRPVLQQLEMPGRPGRTANDCLEPVSRYFDRIVRPEQLVWSALEAARVLTDPAETGTVTLALPQDVQAEAFDFPEELFTERIWHVGRPLPDRAALDRAVALLRVARRPLIVAGGGVIYSGATQALRGLVDATGIPVAETMAGKGSLPYDHPSCLGAAGVTGTPGANAVAREADVVLGVGTRWSDFTTASQTAFADPHVRFVNVNVTASDAHKFAGEALVGDARATLDALAGALGGWHVEDAYRAQVARHVDEWDAQVSAVYGRASAGLPTQGEVIGAVNEVALAAAPREGVVINAAGSMPGDLHKLWRTRDPASYHVEYGYSTMGYELPAGIGVRLADPDRDVYVLIGDGSYLMLSGDLVTAVQERLRLVVVLVQNHGYASIGALSETVGTERFGTQHRLRGRAGRLDGDVLPVDLAANAASLGATVHRARTIDDVRDSLKAARDGDGVQVVHVETEPGDVPGADVFWDVPVAAVATTASARAARSTYERGHPTVRHHL